jgi:hypothetical protein
LNHPSTLIDAPVTEDSPRESEFPRKSFGNAGFTPGKKRNFKSIGDGAKVRHLKRLGLTLRFSKDDDAGVPRASQEWHCGMG